MAISSVHELFDMMPELSQVSRQCVVANLINPIAGFEAVPLPVLAEKLYSASEIGKLFDVSANKIGRIANDNNMKTEQYGEYHLDKSRHSDKQVQAFRYTTTPSTDSGTFLLPSKRRKNMPWFKRLTTGTCLGYIHYRCSKHYR